MIWLPSYVVKTREDIGFNLVAYHVYNIDSRYVLYYLISCNLQACLFKDVVLLVSILLCFFSTLRVSNTRHDSLRSLSICFEELKLAVKVGRVWSSMLPWCWNINRKYHPESKIIKIYSKLESSFPPTFGKSQEDEVHRVELQKQVSEAAELKKKTYWYWGSDLEPGMRS